MQEHRELADSVCDFYTPCSTGRRMFVVQKGPVANDFNQSGALASIYKMIPNVCHIHHATSPDHKLLRNNTRVRSFDSVGIRVKVKVYELIIA